MWLYFFEVFKRGLQFSMIGGYYWSMKTKELDCILEILYLKWRRGWENTGIYEYFLDVFINYVNFNQFCRVRIREEKNCGYLFIRIIDRFFWECDIILEGFLEFRGRN